MPVPDTLTMMRELIAAPSVSSVSPDIDMSNLGVIEKLAGWLTELGFAVDVLPLKNQPEKAKELYEKIIFNHIYVNGIGLFVANRPESTH